MPYRCFACPGCGVSESGQDARRAGRPGDARPCDQGSGEDGTGRRADAAGNHATCVMAFHADRREARSQQPRGEGSEFNATRKSSPTREDGGLTG